ncbi:hypothetical protein MUY35_04315 [Aliiroseovarius sp. S1339]|uniref:hypothetical protein n=1 Tax=Aliiroseovarius sp. S1339 TaxID=2936990 RepID=UPI0020C140B3|nr:hypothetical protein [Aliiroseovarius sp. S1339]MCK8463071.1 hypothetical protein [Aliiroseovarius sp. S1339]
MSAARKHLMLTPAKSRAVRKIPKSSKGHFVGEFVYNNINGKPQRIGFASYTEFKTAICLIYRDDFADIEEQLASLPFSHPRGTSSEHFFDFRFTTKGGQRICISVKPERIATTYAYQATIGAVKSAAIGNICDAVATVTERNISPIELHNVELYHAARKPEPEIDAIVVDGLAQLETTVSISEFLEGIGLSGRGFFSVARAIRAGHARLFTPEKIRGKTLIERGAVS